MRPKSQAAIFETPTGQFYMVLLGDSEPPQLFGDVGFAPNPLAPIVMCQPFKIEPGKVQIKTQEPGQPPQTESIVLSKRP